MNVSSAADIRQKVEARRYNYFTFPVLEFTIKYRNPDLLKLSLNHNLPTQLAEQIIKGYKANLDGQGKEFLDEAKKTNITADDTLLGELRDKGYILLKELAVSHRILDVPQSDFDNEVIAWADIPEEDAIAFLLHLIQAAQTATTVGGGEISSEDIDNFPNGKQRGKRATAR